MVTNNFRKHVVKPFVEDEDEDEEAMANMQLLINPYFDEETDEEDEEEAHETRVLEELREQVRVITLEVNRIRAALGIPPIQHIVAQQPLNGPQQVIPLSEEEHLDENDDALPGSSSLNQN